MVVLMSLFPSSVISNVIFWLYTFQDISICKKLKWKLKQTFFCWNPPSPVNTHTYRHTHTHTHTHTHIHTHIHLFPWISVRHKEHQWDFVALCNNLFLLKIWHRFFSQANGGSFTKVSIAKNACFSLTNFG